jgi:short subunit dehydrogenase-like uncharacterized protein
VLIVGGYGVFGGRIVELLENEARLTIIVAGRSAEKALAYCDSRGSVMAKLVAAALDRNGNLEIELGKHRPDILIDASGPFQVYGKDSYRLVEACIASGVTTSIWPTVRISSRACLPLTTRQNETAFLRCRAYRAFRF